MRARLADEPLFIIPLMQTAFMVFGAIAGGMYFDEFKDMGKDVGQGVAVTFYIIGILLVIVGLGFLMPPSDNKEQYDESPAPASETPVEQIDTHAGSADSADDSGDPSSNPRKSRKRGSVATKMPMARLNGMNKKEENYKSEASRPHARANPLETPTEVTSDVDDTEGDSKRGGLLSGTLRRFGWAAEAGDEEGVRSDSGSPRAARGPAAEQRRP